MGASARHTANELVINFPFAISVVGNASSLSSVIDSRSTCKYQFNIKITLFAFVGHNVDVNIDRNWMK